MAIPVLIMGGSGTGKTYSLRNIPHEKYALVECQKTMLSFAGGKKFYRTKRFDELKEWARKAAEQTDILVIDDFGYCITDLYIRHSYGDEAYRDQFKIYKEIASEVYHFIDFVNDLPDGKLVYLTMHTDSNDLGDIVPMTVGKLLNDKVNLLGMFNIVILSENAGGEYRFIVDGKAPAKSSGAFEDSTINNDLVVVDRTLRAFLGWEQVIDV